MNDSPAFQFYPADYLSDENVIMMTPRQRGAYWHLCCLAWRSSQVGRLRNDARLLAKLADLTDEQWKEDGDAILKCFSIDTDGYITQKRLLKTWRQQQERRVQTAEAGAASARKRGQTPKRSTATLNGNTSHRSTASLNGETQDSSTATSDAVKPLSILSLSLSEFEITSEDIYSAYPLKADKPPAIAAIKKAMLRCNPSVLLERTKAYSEARKGQDPKFTPLAKKFFDGDRYSDPPSSWLNTGRSQVQQPEEESPF